MSKRFCCALVVLATTITGGIAQPSDACVRDLAAVDGTFTDTLKRLEAAQGGTQAQKCSAWRNHLAVMKAGVAVFKRCMTGHALRENAGQLNDSIGDYEELVARKC